MSVELRPLAYQDVANILPKRSRDLVEEKVSKAKNNLQKFNEGTVEKNWFPLVIALGVAIVAGGVFLTLAAHQILPSGVNVISNLGIGGQISGYCVIGLGVIVAIIGAVKSYTTHRQNSTVTEGKDTYTSGVEGCHHNAEEAEVDNYFRYRLDMNELLILDNESRSEMTIYCLKWSEEDQMAHRLYERVPYEGSTSKEALENWGRGHPDLVEHSSCIDLDTLRQRTENFELVKYPNREVW